MTSKIDKIREGSISCNINRTIIPILTSDIKQINDLYIHKRTTIGNHYHKKTGEYFYLVSGEALLGVNGINFVFPRAGEVYYVAPGVKHSLTAFDNGAHFLVFLTEAFNPEEPDIYGKEDSADSSNTSQGPELS